MKCKPNQMTIRHKAVILHGHQRTLFTFLLYLICIVVGHNAFALGHPTEIVCSYQDFLIFINQIEHRSLLCILYTVHTHTHIHCMRAVSPNNDKIYRKTTTLENRKTETKTKCEIVAHSTITKL